MILAEWDVRAAKHPTFEGLFSYFNGKKFLYVYYLVSTKKLKNNCQFCSISILLGGKLLLVIQSRLAGLKCFVLEHSVAFKTKNRGASYETSYEILLIIQECPDRVMVSITVKPNILPKTLFHRFSPKFIKV